LLDANRLANSGALQPGRFDNRWAVIPQDFPSAERLLQNGIKGVFVRAASIQQDLAHVLRRYQEKGLALSILTAETEKIERLEVPQPSGFRGLWYRLGVVARLRRNATGGFGAVIPVPSTSSGG